MPTIQWREAESRDQYADARRLLNAASILHSTEGANSESARLCYRRAGELLEWLSRAGDKMPSALPLELLAAAAYQLGGNPAMSSALLAQAEWEHPGERLYAHFLRADFDGVIHAISEFWHENLEITDHDASSRVFQEEGEDKLGWFTTVELVRVLGLLADSIRRGETDRFELDLPPFSGPMIRRFCSSYVCHYSAA